LLIISHIPKSRDEDLIYAIINEFVKELSNKIRLVMDLYVNRLLMDGVSVFRLENAFISNFGEFSLIVDYSNSLRENVDASTVELSVEKFGNPANYVLAFFARSFSESSFKLASKKPIVIFSLGTMTAFGSAIYKITHLLEFLKSHGIKFEIISSFDSLFSKNYLFMEAVAAFSWFFKRNECFGPNFFLDLLINRFLSDKFWSQREDLIYKDIADALSIVGFTVHEKLGGEYADIYIMQPMKILIEVKNEKAGKDAVEQVMRYTRSSAEIDNYLNNKTIKGPWLPMIIGYDFTSKAIELSEQNKIVLLDKKGFVLFLKYFSIIPPTRFEILDFYTRGGLINDFLEEKINEVMRNFSALRSIIKYIQTNPRIEVNQLESFISEVLGIPRDKVSKFLDSISMFPKLVDRRKVLVPASFRLIHFIKMYELLKGDVDVSV